MFFLTQYLPFPTHKFFLYNFFKHIAINAVSFFTQLIRGMTSGTRLIRCNCLDIHRTTQGSQSTVQSNTRHNGSRPRSVSTPNFQLHNEREGIGKKSSSDSVKECKLSAWSVTADSGIKCEYIFYNYTGRKCMPCRMSNSVQASWVL
jgi:hypothetical protein